MLRPMGESWELAPAAPWVPRMPPPPGGGVQVAPGASEKMACRLGAPTRGVKGLGVAAAFPQRPGAADRMGLVPALLPAPRRSPVLPAACDEEPLSPGLFPNLPVWDTDGARTSEEGLG